MVLADRKAEAARQVAAEIDATGARTLAVQADVASKSSVAALVKAAAAWGGGVDILINNAAIAEGDYRTWDMPLAVFERTIAVDMTGVFLCCRGVLPGMIERGWGRIVNISSIAGKEGKYNPVVVRIGEGGRHRPDKVGRIRGRAVRDPRERRRAGFDLGDSADANSPARWAASPPRSSKRPAAVIRSGNSADPRRSRQWSRGWRRTRARSRRAPCSTSQADAPATESRLPHRRPRMRGRLTGAPTVDEPQHQAAHVPALVRPASIGTGRVEARIGIRVAIDDPQRRVDVDAAHRERDPGAHP